MKCRDRTALPGATDGREEIEARGASGKTTNEEDSGAHSDDSSFDFNEYWQVPTREDWEGWQRLNLGHGHKGIWQRAEDLKDGRTDEPRAKRRRIGKGPGSNESAGPDARRTWKCGWWEQTTNHLRQSSPQVNRWTQTTSKWNMQDASQRHCTEAAALQHRDSRSALWDNRWHYTASSSQGGVPSLESRAAWKYQLDQLRKQNPQVSNMEVLTETLRTVMNEQTGGRMQAIQVSLVSNMVGTVLSLVADTLGQVLANVETSEERKHDAMRREVEEEWIDQEAGDEAESTDERENDAIRREVEEEWDTREQLWKWGYRAPGEADQVMKQCAAAGKRSGYTNNTRKSIPTMQNYWRLINKNGIEQYDLLSK